MLYVSDALRFLPTVFLSLPDIIELSGNYSYNATGMMRNIQ